MKLTNQEKSAIRGSIVNPSAANKIIQLIENSQEQQSPKEPVHLEAQFYSADEITNGIHFTLKDFHTVSESSIDLDRSTGKVTIPEDGSYMISMNLTFASSEWDADSTYACYFSKTGDIKMNFVVEHQFNESVNKSVSSTGRSTTTSFKAGDELTFNILIQNGSPKQLQGPTFITENNIIKITKLS